MMMSCQENPFKRKKVIYQTQERGTKLTKDITLKETYIAGYIENMVEHYLNRFIKIGIFFGFGIHSL